MGGCETVQSSQSQYAYSVGMPVAIWGLGAYRALLALALTGVGLLSPWPRFVVLSAYLTYLEAAVIRAWCRWCVVWAISA